MRSRPALCLCRQALAFDLCTMPYTNACPSVPLCQALAFVLWQFITNFILEPTAMQCFNHTLNRLKTDPRITVRLGSTDEIRGALQGRVR